MKILGCAFWKDNKISASIKIISWGGICNDSALCNEVFKLGMVGTKQIVRGCVHGDSLQ